MSVLSLVRFSLVSFCSSLVSCSVFNSEKWGECWDQLSSFSDTKWVVRMWISFTCTVAPIIIQLPKLAAFSRKHLWFTWTGKCLNASPENAMDVWCNVCHQFGTHYFQISVFGVVCWLVCGATVTTLCIRWGCLCTTGLYLLSTLAYL